MTKRKHAEMNSGSIEDENKRRRIQSAPPISSTANIVPYLRNQKLGIFTPYQPKLDTSKKSYTPLDSNFNETIIKQFKAAFVANNSVGFSLLLNRHVQYIYHLTPDGASLLLQFSTIYNRLDFAEMILSAHREYQKNVCQEEAQYLKEFFPDQSDINEVEQDSIDEKRILGSTPLMIAIKEYRLGLISDLPLNYSEEDVEEEVIYLDESLRECILIGLDYKIHRLPIPEEISLLDLQNKLEDTTFIQSILKFTSQKSHTVIKENNFELVNFLIKNELSKLDTERLYRLLIKVFKHQQLDTLELIYQNKRAFLLINNELGYDLYNENDIISNTIKNNPEYHINLFELAIKYNHKELYEDCSEAIPALIKNYPQHYGDLLRLSLRYNDQNLHILLNENKYIPEEWHCFLQPS